MITRNTDVPAGKVVSSTCFTQPVSRLEIARAAETVCVMGRRPVWYQYGSRNCCRSLTGEAGGAVCKVVASTMVTNPVTSTERNLGIATSRSTIRHWATATHTHAHHNFRCVHRWLNVGVAQTTLWSVHELAPAAYEVKILLLAIYQLQALFESSNAMDSTRLQGCYHRRIPA